MPVVLLVILGVFGILAWRDLKLALTLVIALAPAYLLRFEIGIPWTMLEGMMLISFGVWGVQRVIARRQGRALPLQDVFGPYRWPMGLLLVAATVSIIWTPDTLAALGLWKAYFLEPALVFIMLRTTFTHREDWIRALMGLGVTTIFISIFAIFQKLTGLGLPIPWDIERRATSIFEYPNAVGLFVAPIVAALVVTITDRLRVVAMGAIGLGLAAIVLAETEAALVAIPGALLLTLLASPAQTKIKILAVVGSAMIAATMFALVPTVREKLLLEDYSGGVRRAQWGETVELLKDRPLTGAGLAGYPTALEPYHDPRLYEIFQYPHNLVLNVWVEIGLLGLIAACALAIVAGRSVWANRTDVLVLAAGAALATMAIHGLVDVPFFKNDLAVLTAFFIAMTLTGWPSQTRGGLSYYKIRY
jgi:putative inorganic carbon (hco3(-)) transporter